MLLKQSRFILALTLAAAARAQAPEELVLRITVNLVQLDAVVTDGSGRHVTDLKAGDFEIRQDGKPQRVTNATYINLGPAPSSPAAAVRVPGAPIAPPRPGSLRPDRVRRTVALVVDDMGLAFESVVEVRRALKKFVDEQMQPGDMVGIFRTLGTLGALQQFTDDKRQLYATIERVRWGVANRTVTPGSDSFELERQASYFVSSLDSIESIARALKGLPGRKSLMLFTESMNLVNSCRAGESTSDCYTVLLRRVVDAASRSGVVIYSIDPRGLPTLSLRATFGQANQETAMAALNQTRTDHFYSQDGMYLLAKDTGGMLLHQTNDISSNVQRALDDQQGYYLLAYRPDDATFTQKDSGRPRFHELSVRVKRRGLNVRTRSGFYAAPDFAPFSKTLPTPAQSLIEALISPFGATDIPLGMTATFFDNPKGGSFLETAIHIDPAGLTFTDGPDGRHQLQLDVVSIVFGDQGREVDRGAWSAKAELNDQEYKAALTHGFLHNLTIPVKDSGAFRLRVAVRDTVSGRIGSVGQFIEVPDVAKDRMTLSGIILDRVRAEAEPLYRRDSVLRVFRRGSAMTYGYQVLYPRLDPATRQPQLEAQLRLFRDGNPVYSGKPADVDAAALSDGVHRMSGGNIALGPEMPPGDYIMQIEVTDKLASGAARTATQSIDFQVAP
jgi:VWFA-related protein